MEKDDQALPPAPPPPAYCTTFDEVHDALCEVFLNHDNTQMQRISSLSLLTDAEVHILTMRFLVAIARHPTLLPIFQARGAFTPTVIAEARRIAAALNGLE